MRVKRRIILRAAVILLVVGLLVYSITGQSKSVISNPEDTQIVQISTRHSTKYQSAAIGNFIVDEETENEIIEILSKYNMKKTDYDTETIENDQVNFLITLMDGDVEKTVWVGKVNLCEVKSESYVGNIEDAEALVDELNETCKIIEKWKERNKLWGLSYSDEDYELL